MLYYEGYLYFLFFWGIVVDEVGLKGGCALLEVEFVSLILKLNHFKERLLQFFKAVQPRHSPAPNFQRKNIYVSYLCSWQISWILIFWGSYLSSSPSLSSLHLRLTSPLNLAFQHNMSKSQSLPVGITLNLHHLLLDFFKASIDED